MSRTLIRAPPNSILLLLLLYYLLLASHLTSSPSKAQVLQSPTPLPSESIPVASFRPERMEIETENCGYHSIIIPT